MAQVLGCRRLVRWPRGRRIRGALLVQLRVPIRPDGLGRVEPLHGSHQRWEI